jgi:endonuclease/exonuclease/phosphatase family metal-dependent hydrolase
VANLHTQAAPHQVELATTVAASWSGRLPLVIGGDFNLRTPALPGLEHAGGHEVDHVFVRGNAPSKRETRVLDAGRLSDHAPLLVRVLE